MREGGREWRVSLGVVIVLVVVGGGLKFEWERRCFFSLTTYHPSLPPSLPSACPHEQSTFSESSSKKNGFSIVTSGKGFQLNAETPEEKQAWTQAVTSAIRSLQRQPAAAPPASSSSSSSSSSGGSRPTQQQLSQGVVVGGKMKKDTKTFYVVGTEFVLDARYELIKPIGHGAYGVVISATDAQIGQKVAIKKCPNAFEDLVDAKRIVREIRLLMHFRHENIVRVLDLQAPPVADFDDVYIISELMDTDLHRVIYSRQKLTDDHVQFFLYQMLCALKYIHSAKVIHRDLKVSLPFLPPFLPLSQPSPSLILTVLAASVQWVDKKQPI